MRGSRIDGVDAIFAKVRFHRDRKVTGDMLRQAGAVGWSRCVWIGFPNTSIYAPFLYLPAVAGFFAGKQLGLSIARTLMLARAAGGLASVAVASVAIAQAGEAAPLLFVLLSLPMSLSLFAAVSQDGLMLAAAAIATAIAARRPAERHARTAMIALCVALGLVCVGRPAYAPLAMLPLLLPGYSRAVRGAGALGVLGAIFMWSAIAARFIMINADAGRGVNPHAQLVGLILHPGRIHALAARALADRQGMEGLRFYQEFVGVLGWIDVVLPRWFYGFSVVMLGVAVAAQVARPAGALTAGGKGMLGVAMAGAIGTLFFLEYLTFTPVGFPWVEGVQGRYFLPIALFAALVVPGVRHKGCATAATVARWGMVMFPTVSVVVTVVSVVRRYYV